MRITMRVAVSGTADGVELPAAGETADLPDSLAAELLASGHAVAAEEPARSGGGRAETATAAPAAKRSR